jgi:hypothetical protein
VANHDFLTIQFCRAKAVNSTRLYLRGLSRLPGSSNRTHKNRSFNLSRRIPLATWHGVWSLPGENAPSWLCVDANSCFVPYTRCNVTAVKIIFLMCPRGSAEVSRSPVLCERCRDLRLNYYSYKGLAQDSNSITWENQCKIKEADPRHS